MANDEVAQSPKEFRIGFSEQATFGTAIADNGAFTELQCDQVEVNRDVKRIDVTSSHGTRNMLSSNIIMHTNGSMPSFTIPNLLLKKEEVAFWLYAFFQSVTEGATTPYDKTFVFHGSDPDFQSNAGMFMTFIARDPASSKSIKVVDCILRSLNFTLTKGDCLRASMEFVGRGLPSVVSDPSGTWTMNGTSNLFYAETMDRCTVDFGSGADSFHLQQADIALTRVITGIGQDGSGNHQTVSIGNPTGTVTLKVVKDSDFHEMLTSHPTDEELDLNIGWGNSTPGTDDGDLDFQCHGKIADEPTLDKGGEVVYANCPLTMCADNAETTEPCTAVVADAVDRSW